MAVPAHSKPTSGEHTDTAPLVSESRTVADRETPSGKQGQRTAQEVLTGVVWSIIRQHVRSPEILDELDPIDVHTELTQRLHINGIEVVAKLVSEDDIGAGQTTPSSWLPEVADARQTQIGDSIQALIEAGIADQRPGGIAQAIIGLSSMLKHADEQQRLEIVAWAVQQFTADDNGYTKLAVITMLYSQHLNPSTRADTLARLTLYNRRTPIEVRDIEVTEGLALALIAAKRDLYAD